MERRPVKSIAFAALLLGLGALALLTTAELLLRTTDLGSRGTQAGLHMLRLDRPWLFGLRPGFRGTLELTGPVVYAINADGFRGRAYAPAPPPGAFRILALGASTTFGWGVGEGDTWPARLERILDPAGQRVEVLNLAVNGYNPYNEAALLADRGLAYRPDLVLVEFGVASIMDPSLLFDAQTRLHPALIPDAALPDPKMRRPVPAYAALLRPCQALRSCSLLVDALGLGGPADVREALAMLYPRVPSETESAWLARQYGEMARLAREARAGFAVILFPHRQQLRGKLSAGPQATVTRLGQAGGWPTYDLLPVLRSATQAGRSAEVMLDGWHLSAVGHAVAAHAIARWLSDAGLYPERPRG